MDACVYLPRPATAAQPCRRDRLDARSADAAAAGAEGDAVVRPKLEICELVVMPNAPALLDRIVIGTKIQRPPGIGWELEAILIAKECTRWVRRRPARLTTEKDYV